MAAANAIFLTKPSVFNVPKAFHSSGTGGASNSLSFPRKFSRVRFTSVSVGKEGTFSVDETISSVGDKVSEVSGNTEKSALEQKANIEEGAGKLKDNIEKNINELTKNANGSFTEGKDNITKGAQEIKDNADVNINNLKEKTSEIAGQAAEKFEEASKNLKEGSQGAWDAATEKAQAIKDAVDGKQ